jgi:hypothetical protein
MKSTLLLPALLSAALAAAPAEYLPGASYDARIPTMQKVLGHASGERITNHAGIVRYMEALAAAAPARMKVFEYGESFEGRKLIYGAIASEANLKRLAEIRAQVALVADPRRTPEAEARKIMAGLPVVVLLTYGVHGNEISSPDAALFAAYHLLAARNDKVVDSILAHAVVLIDPIQNPDGRDRFIHNFEQNRGPDPDPSPAAAERNEPWPGGRGNHYLLDMNRDWIAFTQPEIQAEVKLMREWMPLVCVDLHEMGSDATYYFAPAADPLNPHLTARQKEAYKLFGQNNARWFDRFGFDYFTRETFDNFYPGYGESWPAYYGGIAMTYEQASTRGLAVMRSDDTEMKFAESVRRHFVASIATAEAAAMNRERLLEDFYQYRRTAVEEGKTEPVREYILPRGADTAPADKLAAILAEHGIEVKRATAAFKSGDREFAAGTYVVTLAQPEKRRIRTLLDPDVPMEAAFLKEQNRRRSRKLPDEIYDVTGWSLPLMFNVECVGRPEPAQGSFEPVKAERIRPGEIVRSKNPVAYLVPWGTAAGRLLAAAHRQNLRVHTSDKAFTLNGTKYPAGTLIFKTAGNPATLADTLARLAASSGARVVGTDSSWVDEGVNFGSRHVVYLKKPAIAMAWDSPVSSMAAGATRFVIERQFGYPVTVIRASQIGYADLSKFNVLILPPGGFGRGYAEAFGDGSRLKSWVAGGGVLIGIADAVSYLADKRLGLLDLQQENRFRETDPKKPEPAKPEAAEARAQGKVFASEADFTKSIQADRELPDDVAGVLVRARIDPDHWLGAGVAERVIALASGRAIFTPVKLDKGVNVAVFEAPDKLVASGYMWEENRKQMAFKPLVVAQQQGRGIVIGFTTDPSHRASLDSMNVLFLNAVFRSARSSGGRGGEE